MKTFVKFKFTLIVLLFTACIQPLFAQTKANVFDEKTPITWLGLDFSQTEFIGDATKGVVSNKGTVTNDEFRDMYTLEWNQLFIDEIKKYDVAKAVHRPEVKYAIDVTVKANKELTKKDFFSNNPSDFKKITESDIANIVKNYDFQNNEGIGMIFFVEGMSKGQEAAGVWVTFVDMKAKTVLFTTYQTEKPGGFGFRNYWAKPFYEILKNMDSNFKKWSKM